MNPDNFNLNIDDSKEVPDHSFASGFVPFNTHIYNELTFSDFKSEIFKQLYNLSIDVRDFYLSGENFHTFPNFDAFLIDCWRKNSPLSFILTQIKALSTPTKSKRF